MKHISFERNSHVKVRNTLLVEKLTKGYLSHIPPFGNEAHLFCAQFMCQGQKHIVGLKA